MVDDMEAAILEETDIPKLESRLVGYLMIYKRCRTDEERRMMQHLIQICQERIECLKLQDDAYAM